MVANVETMAYVKRTDRDIPWHKLGTSVPEGMSSAEEIINAAQLNWNVALRPVFLDDGRQVPNAQAIVRDRDDRIFGVATDSYTPLQNLEAFESVSEWLADGRMQFETAGALGDGSRVWGLARIGDDFRVSGKDAIAPYVLLWTGHDGASSLVLKPVTTRVVCQNTVNIALRERGFKRYNIRHTASIRDRVRDASKALGLVRADVYALQEKFDILAQTASSDADLTAIAELVAPFPAAPKADASYAEMAKYEKDRKSANEERMALWKVYNHSLTVDRGTKWGVFNAVTEYLDHFQQRRGQNPDSKNADWLERRAVFSIEAGQDMRQKVYDTLIAV